MKVSLDTLVSLAKRRGFVWQASEIYGALAGFYNYGPYGTAMMQNIKKRWWKDFVQNQSNIVGLDSSIIQHSELWRASGHLDQFSDPMVEDIVTKKRYRADELAEIETNDLKELTKALRGKKSPDGNELSEPRYFNMMFETFVGPVMKYAEPNIEVDESGIYPAISEAGAEVDMRVFDKNTLAYLRPETAGGIFTDFDLVRNVTRQRIPFGIAQIGKAFRNEISPREWLFRLREFSMAELEYFVEPKSANKEFRRWLEFSKKWLLSIGLDNRKITEHEHTAKERSHYSAKTIDIIYQFPFGKKELWGIANRTDFDLKAHSRVSGKDLSYYDQDSGKKYQPYIIEPSLGLDRLFFALLDSAYHEEEVRGEKRVVLKLTSQIAPLQIAVLPLSKDSKLSPLARKVYDQIKDDFMSEYDETQSIGRRYRRQDEIGTPLCVTIDFDSLTDKAVTIRDRDSMRQKRVKITALKEELTKQLK